MNSDQIQDFLNKITANKPQYVKINFQKREPIYGLFLTNEKDSKDLSIKNFWRIKGCKPFPHFQWLGNDPLVPAYGGILTNSPSYGRARL
jgi:hypothetical protein